jgi:hypothetical protein
MIHRGPPEAAPGAIWNSYGDCDIRAVGFVIEFEEMLFILSYTTAAVMLPPEFLQRDVKECAIANWNCCSGAGAGRCSTTTHRS